MDTQVGKVLKILRDEVLEDNTIVIFTSDHGFHLGEHKFCMKVSLHEESVRVSMIIKVPGKKPAVTYSLVEFLDLYPTIAELAGLNLITYRVILPPRLIEKPEVISGFLNLTYCR